MDSVRFGRALGMGTRGAAKALAMAAEAAAAPTRSLAKPTPAAASKPTPDATASRPSPAKQAGQTFHQAQLGLLRGGKRFGQAAGGSFLRLAGVLWLELTGVFFGLFVLFAGGNAWNLRGNLHDTGINHAAHQHLLWSLAMTALFGYFCISSFVRARQRERRGQHASRGDGKVGRRVSPP